MVYDGGKVNVFQDLPKSIDASYVKELIDSLGYNDVVKLHFLDPRKELHNGIRFMGFDRQTFDPFLALLLDFRLIHIYTEHETVSLADNSPLDGVGSFMELCGVDESLGPRTNDCQSKVYTNADIDYDSEGTDDDDEGLVNARKKVIEEKRKEKSYDEEVEMLKRVAANKEMSENIFGSDFDGDSDLDSPNESHEDDCGYLAPPPSMAKFKVANKGVDGGDFSIGCKFYVGQHFENAKTFRRAIIDYSIEIGRDLPFSRNDCNRVRAKCINKDKGCPWKI
ncbi:Transposon Ty2-GR1 Gag-Pol polyprotein [Bienertia sinuspersici]